MKAAFDNYKSSWDFRLGFAFMKLCDIIGEDGANDLCWALSKAEDYRVGVKWLEWYLEVFSVEQTAELGA